MNVKGAFVYLGIETIHSEKQNKDFKSGCFLQGTDVQKVFLSDATEKLLDGIMPGSAVAVELDIKTGQKTFVSLVSVAPVNSDKQKTA